MADTATAITAAAAIVRPRMMITTVHIGPSEAKITDPAPSLSPLKNST
jgi:hypothetical protein